MVIDLNRESRVPLYMQIVTQVRALITRGALSDGDRLPAHRELATKLGINRTTVITAYTELAAEGLIRSRPGSGTFICDVSTTRHREEGCVK
jgi:DNA-binding transcriptional regulator YhcF (GntR family)